MEYHSVIERIKNKGRDDALKEIYSKYRNEFILWAIRHHSCTMEEAKDIFQQAVIIFYENIIYEKVSEISTKVKTYLFSIGKNKLLELLREKSKHVPQFNEFEMVNADIYYDAADDGYEDKLKRVQGCMDKLGDPCKSILEHYYYHKRSMQEIAEILEYKNSDTVKNLKYKCLQRLRQIFTVDYGSISEQLL